MRQQLETKGSEVEGAETEKIMVVDATKRLLPGELPKEKPFDLEVTFQLSGARAIKLTKQSFPYHTKVYGQNRLTRQKLTLGQTPVETLVDGKLYLPFTRSDVARGRGLSSSGHHPIGGCLD